MDVLSKSRKEYGACSLESVPVPKSSVITTAYTAMISTPFKGSAGFGFPIGGSFRRKLITVVNGITRCIMIPGYEVRSGTSGTRGDSPTITTANMTASVVAEDSRRKYTGL